MVCWMPRPISCAMLEDMSGRSIAKTRAHVVRLRAAMVNGRAALSARCKRRALPGEGWESSSVGVVGPHDGITGRPQRRRWRVIAVPECLDQVDARHARAVTSRYQL